jgi:hypothetical protein
MLVPFTFKGTELINTNIFLMCTVTYIPGFNKGFLLAHNRDERIDRPMATPPLSRMIKGSNVIYPVDPEGKGTWIGISSDGKVASLLNGGTKKHERTPPYKHSRGLVIPAYFSFPNVTEFSGQYDFSGLEPFTLIAIESEKIFVLVWENETLSLKEKNSKLPHIFFSRSLYPGSSLESRSSDFLSWYMDNRNAGENDALNYNLTQKFESDQIAKFDNGSHILKTVSVSVISWDKKITRFLYYDTLNDLRLSNSVSIKNAVPETSGNQGVLV